MADFSEGVGLVHELRELAAAEEFFHGSYDRAYVDERIGSGLAWLLDAHAFFDDALHTQQADTELGLDQLANAAHAAVAEVVDVIFASDAVVEFDEAAHNIDKVVKREGALALWDRQVELTVQFVASDAAEVVATGVEKHVFDERAGIVDGSRVAGSHLFI